MPKPFFVYILLCSDLSYYTGETDDLEKRINEHQSGNGGYYTSIRRPVKLVWSQEFSTREEARSGERQIKNWSKNKKKALINGDFDLLKELSRKKWAYYNNSTK